MKNEQSENKLKEMIKKKEECDRLLLALEWVIGIISVAVLLTPVLFGALLKADDTQITIMVLINLILFIAGIFVALKIEQIAGYYECKHCGHRQVPTFKAVFLAAHMGRTRYLKCPECKKKSWQKKMI